MKKSMHSSRGSTLIEMLIYMSLLAFMLIALSELFLSSLEAKTESVGIAAVQQDSQYLLTRLHHDLRRATAVTTPATLGSSSTNLVLVINSETYSYALNNGVLELTTPQGTERLNNIGTQVSSLNFTRIGPTSGLATIRFDLTLTSQAQLKTGPYTINLSSTGGGLW